MTKLVGFVTYNKRNITWDPNKLFGPCFACDTAVVETLFNVVVRE